VISRPKCSLLLVFHHDHACGYDVCSVNFERNPNRDNTWRPQARTSSINQGDGVKGQLILHLVGTIERGQGRLFTFSRFTDDTQNDVLNRRAVRRGRHSNTVPGRILKSSSLVNEWMLQRQLWRARRVDDCDAVTTRPHDEHCSPVVCRDHGPQMRSLSLRCFHFVIARFQSHDGLLQNECRSQIRKYGGHLLRTLGLVPGAWGPINNDFP
jgi:hypothetical protein